MADLTDLDRAIQWKRDEVSATLNAYHRTYRASKASIAAEYHCLRGMLLARAQITGSRVVIEEAEVLGIDLVDLATRLENYKQNAPSR